VLSLDHWRRATQITNHVTNRRRQDDAVLHARLAEPKDEFVLHCDTIDSPSTYTGRGESDFGEYTIVGECINGELDSAEFTFRKLV